HLVNARRHLRETERSRGRAERPPRCRSALVGRRDNGIWNGGPLGVGDQPLQGTGLRCERQHTKKEREHVSRQVVSLLTQVNGKPRTVPTGNLSRLGGLLFVRSVLVILCH